MERRYFKHGEQLPLLGELRNLEPYDCTHVFRCLRIDAHHNAPQFQSNTEWEEIDWMPIILTGSDEIEKLPFGTRARVAYNNGNGVSVDELFWAWEKQGFPSWYESDLFRWKLEYPVPKPMPPGYSLFVDEDKVRERINAVISSHYR